MKEFKTQDFPEVYKELGIKISDLGCVMLDCEPPFGDMSKFGDLDLYTSKNPDHGWIKGWVAGKHPHITLLYGLMKPAREYKVQINQVLKDWEYKEAEIEEIGFFDSPYEDEQYWCIVAHIKVTPELLEGHQRLELLPHINTFAGYKPHMTIAYITKKRGIRYRDMVISSMNDKWSGKMMKVSSLLNLGSVDK